MADIFAAGTVLFILYAGNPPFPIATLTDPWYKKIAEGNVESFWQGHQKTKSTPDYFSASFKDLVTGMIRYESAERFTLAQVMSHPWMSEEPTASLEEA